jgi:hypothetical protein
MSNDLLPLFTTPETLASTTVMTAFKDITVKNKDARAILDQNGKSILLYSFFDNNMLIITDNESSLNTLVGLLNSAKLAR